MNEVTRVLSAIEEGDLHAAEQLLPLVNEELRKLAAQGVQPTYVQNWECDTRLHQVSGQGIEDPDECPRRDVDLVNHLKALERLPIAGQVRCKPLASQTDSRREVPRAQPEPTDFWATRMVPVCLSRVRGQLACAVLRGREDSDILLLPDHRVPWPIQASPMGG
jgi:hypothetical protein